MNLYNLVHGENALASELLQCLGLQRQHCGRYRDCYLQRCSDSGELRIYVLTRDGNGNRANGAEAIEYLRLHPYYLSDHDEPSDHTYASFVFRVPVLQLHTFAARVLEDPGLIPESLAVRSATFASVMADFPDDPRVKRVLAGITPAMKRVEEASRLYGTVALLDGDAGVSPGPKVIVLGDPNVIRGMA